MESPEFEKEGRFAFQIFFGLSIAVLVFLCVASFLLGRFVAGS